MSGDLLLFKDGRFKLLAPLGAAANGGVFLADDLRDKRQVALKLLEIARVPEEAQERFLAEARVLSTVRHKHVVHSLAGGHDNGFVWYAMDLMSGGSLRDHVKDKGACPPEPSVCAVFQILMALDCVHAVGLIHRDVKLTNAMVGPDGTVRLSDFGIAHHPEGSVPFTTVPGQALGTPGYGAPEQWDDAGQVGPPADIFAAGVLLYRLLTRRRPDRLHLAHYRSGLLDDVPKPLRKVVLGSTFVDLERRYSTVLEMARALANARDELLDVKEADIWIERFRDPDAHWGDAFDPLFNWFESEPA